MLVFTRQYGGFISVAEEFYHRGYIDRVFKPGNELFAHENGKYFPGSVMSIVALPLGRAFVRGKRIIDMMSFTLSATNSDQGLTT